MGEGRKRLGTGVGGVGVRTGQEAGWYYWFRVAGLPDSVPPTWCWQWGRGQGRAECQGGQEGCCVEPSVEQTLVTDHSRLPFQLDVKLKDAGRSGWRVFVAQTVALLC